MEKTKWDVNNIVDQKGRVIVVTGSTSGIGKEAARVLAGKNAKVILAVRNLKKGEATREAIQMEFPDTEIKVRGLNLSSLTSVREFAEKFNQDFKQMDVLINNAGVMACPYAETADGFEMQMGTNHLGHFALTGLLMPLLKNTKDSRVVVLSSIGHKMGKIDLDDLNWQKRKYNTNQAYFDSKLANLYFAYELSRRFEGRPNAPKVTAAHPGWTQTGLQKHSGLMIRFLNPIFGQQPKIGALPTLRAGFDNEAKPCDYYGPRGIFELKGYPVKTKSNALSHDVQKAQKLWEISENLTSISYKEEL